MVPMWLCAQRTKNSGWICIICEAGKVAVDTAVNKKGCSTEPRQKVGDL